MVDKYKQKARCRRYYQENKEKVLNQKKGYFKTNIKKICKHRKDKRNMKKTALISYKGGKCERCGLVDDCVDIYDFHHLDPKEKDFSISCYSGKSLENLKKEVDKCILVCANCHRKIHKEERETPKEKG